MVGDLMESACQDDGTEKLLQNMSTCLRKTTFNIMYREGGTVFVMAKGRNIINLDSKCKVLLKNLCG